MTGARQLLDEISAALPWPGPSGPVELPAGGSLPSVFRVSDLAQASVAAAAASLSALVGCSTGDEPPAVSVDRDLASAWFAFSIRPQGWALPPTWDPVAGDYRGADGWIRLHTNAPHHRAAALGVLGVAPERERVAAAVALWGVDALEDAVVAAGGAAARMRTAQAWAAHPQGRAVAAEPLLEVTRGEADPAGGRPVGERGRPLAGIRVLDLTRVLAGPVATRLLAGWGAEVLRIDPPTWDEPAVAAEVTLGKRCARLDLRDPEGRDRLLELLTSADVVVHGYRSDALEGLGLGPEVLRAARPGLVDVALDAYGWSGPWRHRRGFDSLVQMSAGIAAAGGEATGEDRPVPLPVQALDHATGYLLAAAAVTGLAMRVGDGHGTTWRASLARTARMLVDAGHPSGDGTSLVVPDPTGPPEATPWGPALRLAPPASVTGAPLRWDLPARPLGHDRPEWSADPPGCNL